MQVSNELQEVSFIARLVANGSTLSQPAPHILPLGRQRL